MSNSDLAQPEKDWGRSERRIPIEVAVEIQRLEDSSSAEKTVTRNISSRGACILTKQRWEPNDLVVLTSLGARRPEPVRVVYCEPLASDHNAIGIVVQTPSGPTLAAEPRFVALDRYCGTSDKRGREQAKEGQLTGETVTDLEEMVAEAERRRSHDRSAPQRRPQQAHGGFPPLADESKSPER